MRKIFLLMIMCITFLGSTFAQNSVTGKVTDNEGLGIPGATVLEKGTINGTLTDNDGKYSIKVASEKSIIVFSFVGMTTLEETVKSRLVINVKLTSADIELGELVVTALGIRRKEKALGYAMSSIKGNELLKAGNSDSPLASIYGKAAGVGVSIGSAGPTGSINVKIRGAGGLEANAKTRPLFVVDGVPIYDENTNMSSRGYNPLNSFDYGTGINDLNSEDIESIEILKGAKAAVLYGSAGANGVMLFTTKSGAKTRGLGVQFSYQHNIDKPKNYIDWQNEFGSGTSIYDTVFATVSGKQVRKINTSRFQFGPKFDNSTIMFFDSTMVPYRAYPHNFDDLFKPTSTDIYSFAISGGSEKGSMRVGYTNKDYKGFLDNFYQKSNSLSFNGKMKASKLASFELIANFYDVKTQNRYPNLGRLVSYGFNRDYDYTKLRDLYKDKDGYKPVWEDYGLPASVGDNTGYLAMLWDQNENRDNDNKTHLTGTFKTNLQFLPWLSVVTSAGIDYTDWNFITKNKVERILPSIAGGGYSFARKNYTVQNFNAFVNFEKKFFNDKLEVLAFAGPEYRGISLNNISTSTQGGLQFPDWYSLSASKGTIAASHSRSMEVLYSVLGSASFSWVNAYYLELQARQDWSSTLPPENNSYFYPGASLTWNFSETYKIPYLMFGKLRLSWADVGKGAPSAYYANQLYSAGQIYNSDVTTMSGPGSLFSGQLKPERKREYEIGFNTVFFEKGRVNVDFSFYTSNTYNEIMGIPLSSPTGYSQIKINAGKVKRWGYELSITGTPVLTTNFRWDVTFNTANQKSKTIKLFEGITKKAVYGGGSYGIWAEEGKTFGEIKMYDYLKSPDGSRIVSSTGYYSKDDKNLIVAGNINPDFIGGISTDLNYKSFRFSVGLDYKFGGTFLSHSNYYLLGNGQINETLKYRDEAHGGLAYYINNSGKKIKTEHNASVPTGNTNKIIYHDGLILSGVKDNGNGNYTANDAIITSQEYWSTFIQDMNEWFQPDYLYKNDYIKVREVSFAYTVPKAISNKFKMEKVALSVFGRNLFFLYKTMPNIDVESTLGSDSFEEYTYLPSTRSYGFKIDVSF